MPIRYQKYSVVADTDVCWLLQSYKQNSIQEGREGFECFPPSSVLQFMDVRKQISDLISFITFSRLLYSEANEKSQTKWPLQREGDIHWHHMHLHMHTQAYGPDPPDTESCFFATLSMQRSLQGSSASYLRISQCRYDKASAGLQPLQGLQWLFLSWVLVKGIQFRNGWAKPISHGFLVTRVVSWVQW